MRKQGLAALLTASLSTGALFLGGCRTPEQELERVAKDWCLTIRASQVLPVYPLSEDIRPGDVFLVPVPLSKQADVWEERGFLPLDQHVARLDGLPYAAFYADDYFKGMYSGVPHARPGPWAKPTEFVTAPRAAFPTYSFEVDRSAGLKMALPLQGVPVGLGLLGASRARGDVALKDAYTYGVDGAAMIGRLNEWWASDSDVPATLQAITEASPDELYLRVVTRVFLVGEVAVTVSNLASEGAEIAAGAAPEVEIAHLAATDPAAATAAADGLNQVLSKLSAAAGDGAGGRFKFVQASRRSVSMTERFDRPLVIGYVGFDVRVLRDGRLSAPIPSFSVLSRRAPPALFENALSFRQDDLSGPYQAFLDVPANRERMLEWLRSKGAEDDPADLVHAPTPRLRRLLREAAAEFGFGSGVD